MLLIHISPGLTGGVCVISSLHWVWCEVWGGTDPCWDTAVVRGLTRDRGPLQYLGNWVMDPVTRMYGTLGMQRGDVQPWVEVWHSGLGHVWAASWSLMRTFHEEGDRCLRWRGVRSQEQRLWISICVWRCNHFKRTKGKTEAPLGLGELGEEAVIVRNWN